MDLKKIKMLANIVKAIIEEGKKSEASKIAGIDLKKDFKDIIQARMFNTILKNIGIINKAKVESLKEMLNSDEAIFIKSLLMESDKFKEISNKIEKIQDKIPEKINIECINYRYWCLNWFAIGKMGLSAPMPVVKGILKYSWIFDLLKANSMATRQTRGRSGANLLQMQKQFNLIVRDVCDMVQYNLKYPEKTIIKQVMIPSEILQAMDLHFMIPELQGTILPKCDQFAGLKYLDATDAIGLPQDTCSYPRFAEGVALLDEMIPGKCMISSNLPCDGGMASYEVIEQKLGNIPTYRLNIPYDFRNDESIETFAEDLKGMVEFLEKNMDKKLDVNKLRDQCENYNKLVDMEYERWDMLKLDKPPLAGDAIWYPHEWCFNVGSGRKDITKFLQGLLNLDKKAIKNRQQAFPNMRYRTIVWNPPTPYYGDMWGWLERCWGVASVMDLETYGAMDYIDTSTEESMLRGLGKRYMWGTMSKHTRGPAENMLGDLSKVIVDFRPDFVYLPAHVGCKNSMSLEAEMRDLCKKAGIGFCVVRYELLDNRIASRQELRDQFSKFMTEVMHAKPLDPSLLKINDTDPGSW